MAAKRKCYGWDPVKLSDHYTDQELAAWNLEIHADPANANPLHAEGKSIYLLTPKARRQTDALSWAIYHIQQEKCRQRGAA